MASRKRNAQIELLPEQPVEILQPGSPDTPALDAEIVADDAAPDELELPPYSISIRDTGPIEYIVLPILVDGGVVELQADNGKGKTTAIDAVRALSTGKLNATVRDGALDGEVRGPQARLYLNQRRTKREGFLGIAALESDVDPSELVEPGFKDPEVRDLHRMKMVCRFADVKTEFRIFLPVLGAHVAHVSEKAKAQESVPDMASAIEKDLQKRALTIEKEVENARGRAEALGAFAEGFNANIPEIDVDAAYRELADADAALRILLERKQHAERAHEAAERARTTLAQLETNMPRTLDLLEAEFTRLVLDEGDGRAEQAAAHSALAAIMPAEQRARTYVANGEKVVRENAADAERIAANIKELERRLADARDDLAATFQIGEQAAAKLESMRGELRTTEQDVETRSLTLAAATKKLEDASAAKERLAREFAAARQTWSAHAAATQAIQAAGNTAAISDESVRAAEEAAAAAKRAHETSIEQRGARARALEAKRELELMSSMQAEAAGLRETCDALDGVIEAQIARVKPRGLLVRKGRIFLETERGQELYDRLSDGLRWQIAFDAAVDAVGEGGLLTIARYAWVSMSPTRRRQLHAHAQRRRVTVYVERATSGPLRAVVYDPQEDPDDIGGVPQIAEVAS